jgi:general nucleoside transport system ATP-binding protein
LLVSVELEEILSLSDRIAVMFDGKIMGERMPQETDEKELGLLMAGMTSMPKGDLFQAVAENLAYAGGDAGKGA